MADGSTRNIIELLVTVKGGNFNIHICAWLGYSICSKRGNRVYLFGKDLINSLSSADVRAFHLLLSSAEIFSRLFDKQCRSRSDGSCWSSLIWFRTVYLYTYVTNEYISDVVILLAFKD